MARLVLVDDEGKQTPVALEQPDEPFVIRAGKEIASIPRQLGLTARYALEGPAQAAQVFTEPIRVLTDAAVNAFRDKPARGKSAGELATSFADLIGLPKPETPTERVVGDATRLMAGAGATMGAGAAGAGLPKFGMSKIPFTDKTIPLLGNLPGATGITGDILTKIASSPAQQVAAAAGGGLAGGASREAGAGPWGQFGASMLGSVVGGMVLGAASSTANLARRFMPGDVEQKVAVALQRAGVDYSALPKAAQIALRNEIGDALKTGKELDPAALKRLADFRAVGATPTRGMVTQNPVQITREQNLAKIAANSSDEGLSGLPLIQNKNNARLIEVLNESGANSGDPFKAGQANLEAILGRDASLKRSVDQAYAQARELFGRDVPLDRQSVIGSIWDAVNGESKGAFFPKELRQTINRISQGKEPFTVGVLDNLETMLATASRSTQDGNVKRAIQLAREAISNAPLNPVKNQFGGSQVVTAGMGDAMRAADSAPSAMMDALRQARAAARGRFEWQKSSAPVAAAIDGMEPDKFFQKFIVGGTLADAEAIANNGAVEPTKAAIMDFLKSRAISGAADEVGKFSQAAYNKALQQIGERKLRLFFSPEEVSQLKTLGRVASYMQVQPVGSAVNNSNTSGALLGRGYDAVRWMASKIPFGKAAILDPLQNIDVTIRQNQARNVVPGLLALEPARPAYERMIAPTIAASGLLASP